MKASNRYMPWLCHQAKHMLILVVVVSMVACGAGSGSSDTEALPPQQIMGGPAVPETDGLSVTQFDKVGENRVGRSTYDYAFKVTVANHGPAMDNVVVTLKSVGNGATIIQGTTNVGNVTANGSAISTDPLIIRQDRNWAFDRASIVFDITSAGPSATQKAEAVLLPSVRILGAAELATIVEATDQKIIFSSNPYIGDGSIFVANGTAYKAVSANMVGSTSVVNVTAPSVEDIFSKIQISGKYEMADTTAELSRARVAASKVASTFSDTVSFADGPLSGKSTISGSMVLDVDYIYDHNKGGLQSASIQASANVDNTLSLKVAKGAALGDHYIKGKTFFVPISLTIYDALLNKLGAEIAGINIPLGVVLRAEAKLSAEASVTTHAEGKASATFADGVLSGSFVPSGTMDANATVTTTETTNLEVSTSVLVNARPALAALHSVALAGVDIKLGPRLALNAKHVPDRIPDYCLSTLGYLRSEANFFFKTIGVDLKGDAASAELPLYSKPLVGSCLAPTTSALVKWSASSNPPAFGETVDFEIKVLPVKGKEVSGKVPTGNVQVKAGSKACTVPVASDGSGHCAFTPEAAGNNTPVTVSYTGDKVYDQSESTTPVLIAKAKSFVSASAVTTAVSTNTPLTFTAVAGPSTDLSQKLPTGSITIYADDGTTVCTGNLVASGSTACTGQFSKAGTVLVHGVYSGDANYTPGNSATLSITVNEATILSEATMTVPDTQANWSGLPATISLSDLVETPIFQFQLFGNSTTCGTGERGSPLYSAVVPAGAKFYAARTVIGTPYVSTGPGVNRRNCSSFVAVLQVPDPTDPSKKKPRIWVNATGRGQQFSGFTLDWESQIRFDSGDPWSGSGRTCVGGTVANAGFFGAAWNSSTCTVTLNYK